MTTLEIKTYASFVSFENVEPIDAGNGSRDAEHGLGLSEHCVTTPSLLNIFFTIAIILSVCALTLSKLNQVKLNHYQLTADFPTGSYYTVPQLPFDVPATTAH